ncbi:hypothetical protein [Accumulibacter sp.]|uniref:hypothetical protein n=1 Tax=Accumulibacter sp. TaxID=2053492 RepID=UPI00257FB513|nr:hypothetical protein [Accumulibacter sp.]
MAGMIVFDIDQFRHWSRRPLPEWLRSGDVQMVCSPALAGLADAQGQVAAA